MTATSTQAPACTQHPAANPIDPRELRTALGRFTTGVTVITARGDDGYLTGITANSFNSLSLDPPLVLWSLSRKSGSLRVFEQAAHWAVHVLAHDQSDLSAHFARSIADKFTNVEYESSEHGTPLLKNCSARFVCKARHVHDGGDHILLIGEVVEFERCDAPALVYTDSGYAIATNTDARTTPAPGSATENDLGFLLGSAYYHLLDMVRHATGHLGFNNLEFFVLAALNERGQRTRTEIQKLIHYTGVPHSDLQVLDDLEARGLLVANESADGETDFDLTERGRELAQLFSAASLSITEHMEKLIGPSGTIALRALLARFMRDTEAERSVTWI